MSLLNGIALVTGAGSGIGRAVAVAYVHAGARGIALADLDTAALQKTIDLIKGAGLDTQVISIQTDITNLQSVKTMISKTVERFGQIDYAANVAGVNVKVKAPTVNAPLDDFDRVMDINLRGQLLCCQEELKVMRGQNPVMTPGVTNPSRAQRGSIINISSMCGLLALQNSAGYTVSKHAVVGLTKTAAVDHGHELIRVNCVCPGFVDTPFLLPSKAANPTSTYPLDGNVFHRIGLPEEIADVVIFLSSSRSSYVTGTASIVDGGHSAAARYMQSMEVH